MANEEIIVKIFIFALGAVIGSFLNVCIYRLPKSESIILPRSHCPGCKRTIPWHDNIPILSYIFLKGECRFCKFKIPFRYILVELLSAVFLLLVFAFFGLTPKFFAYAILLSGLIVATFVDFEFEVIPDVVTNVGLVAGAVFSVAFPALFGEQSRWCSFLNSVFGMLAGAAIIFISGFFGKFIFKKEAMGEGDIYLLAMIGAFLGWQLTVLTFFLASLFGSIVGVVMKLKYRRETIPFGPYLSLGAIGSIFFGEKILTFLFCGYR